MSDSPNKKPTAFISAAASGIGFAIAEVLAQQGCHIIICDCDKDAIEKINDNYDWQAYLCDVGDPSQVKDMFAKIDRPIDILVNNAGIAGPTAPVECVDFSEWKKCLAVSLDSHLYCTGFVVEQMKTLPPSSQKCIVNITSTAGLYGYPNRSPYVAAKWAICGLTKSWAIELGDYNIRVNAVAPGGVEGERMQRVIKAQAALEGRSEEDIYSDYSSGVSMRSFVSPQEIADMVGFLCSDKARHISGQIIAVDGNTETMTSTLPPHPPHPPHLASEKQKRGESETRGEGEGWKMTMPASNNSTSESKNNSEKKAAENLQPTRYGDWEKNGRCIDF